MRQVSRILLSLSIFIGDEVEIKPAALARWEKISRDLDAGKGLAFFSASKMRGWLKYDDSSSRNSPQRDEGGMGNRALQRLGA